MTAKPDVQEGEREPLTVNISVCQKCDRDRDPWTVPDKPCGHAPEGNRALVAVEVVPREVVERLAEALESAVGTWKWGAETDQARALAEFRAVFPKAEEA